MCAPRTVTRLVGCILALTAWGLRPTAAHAEEPAPAAKTKDAEDKAATEKAAKEKDDGVLAGPPDGRAFTLGVEGTILTTPPLRTRAVYIDPRFVGRSTALGGLGVFARYRPLSFIGFDASVRTGSLRLRSEDDDTTVSSDQVLADVGTLLYLGRGKISQFALSGGLGGLFHRVRYDLDSGQRGTQAFGAFTIRVGAEAEFLVNRIAFILSFRTYGVMTPRSNTRNKGAVFEGRSGPETDAPVATFSTYLSGSAGIGYRF